MQIQTMEASYVEVDGVRLHHRVLGPPEGSPVVVLHGIMGHAREWDALVAPLAAEHRVVVLDQRGHGRSDWTESYAVDDMATDLLAVVERLSLAPARVIGHSMGGMVGMLAAARRPEAIRQLVVIDIGPDSVTEELSGDLRTFLAELAGASYATVDEAVAAWAGNPLARPELLRHYVEHCLVDGDDAGLRWRFDGHGLGRFFDDVSEPQLWEAVDGVRCPTLLVRGEHSWALSTATARAVVDRFADGRLVEIPGGSHDLGVEQPEAIAEASMAFFAAG